MSRVCNLPCVSFQSQNRWTEKRIEKQSDSGLPMPERKLLIIFWIVPRCHRKQKGEQMNTRPKCTQRTRVLTSRAISAEIRETYCQCTHCGHRFRQLAVFEKFIVRNLQATAPDPTLQPDIAKRRQSMLESLGLLQYTPKLSPTSAMTFI